MMFKSSILLLAAGLSGVMGKSCSNQGLERCQAASGTSANIIRCDQGREVVVKCPSGEFCYGNGRSGTMCINPDEEKPLAKRQTSNDPFGGYSSGINSLLKGLNGDSASFNAFLTSSRRAMYTNKNAVVDMSTNLNSGLQQTKQKIGQNSRDLGTAFSSDQNIQGTINKAKLFTSSVSNNLGPFSYAIYDLGTTVSSDTASRNGLARAMTTGYTAVADVNPSDKFTYAPTNQALNNLALASSIYYPRTLGTVMRGQLSPANLATYATATSSGNANGTANIMGSLFNTIAPGHNYMPAFSYAAGRVGRSVATNVNTGVVNNVIKKYKTKNPTNNDYVNLINGAANAVVQTRGKYEGDILGAYNTYAANVDAGCGCQNQSLFAQLFYYLGVLILSILVTPTGACCVPGGGSDFGLSF